MKKTQKSKQNPQRKHRNRFTNINQLVDKVTENVFYKRGFAHKKLITDWRYIVGEVLYTKTVPQKVIFPKGAKTDGILYIQVSIGWATEVQHLEPIILEKIATYFGYKAIKKISILQAPIYRQKPAPEQPEKHISEKDKHIIANMVHKVKDDELKQRLKKLGEALWE